MGVLVYSLFRGESVDVEFFALPCYIFVVEEGPEECFFIMQKRRLARGLPCNLCMASRQRTEATRVTKKVIRQLFHQGKL